MPTVRKLETTLGAVVTDVKLASMDDGQWQTVLNAFHAHALLIFPAQHLSDDEQVQFAERFGDIELLTANPERKAVLSATSAPTVRRWMVRVSLQNATWKRRMAYR